MKATAIQAPSSISQLIKNLSQGLVDYHAWLIIKEGGLKNVKKAESCEIQDSAISSLNSLCNYRSSQGQTLEVQS